ncbi:MAG TPA: hypothetical protein VJS19_08005 [Candidatus Dormibacteraeota bacterium]|nr:hypothetical protein [Candidatus Dormibacteraeota bacterium]
MTRLRWLAGAVIVLLAAYFVMRALATACTGGGCDAYIPASLLLPLLVFVAAAATGLTACVAARGSAWFVWLVISTVVAVAGPLVALLVFKDSPDAFVTTGTVLELQVAVVALAFTLRRTRQGSAR